MAIVLDGTTGISAPALTGLIDAANLTGVIAAAQISGALNASGSAPVFTCRAWVNFNGTGTIAIRASGNVSSITDYGVGMYRLNFTTAMPDANYAVIGSPSKPSVSSWVYWAQPRMPSEILAESVVIQTGYVSGTNAGNYNATQDLSDISVAIFR